MTLLFFHDPPKLMPNRCFYTGENDLIPGAHKPDAQDQEDMEERSSVGENREAWLPGLASANITRCREDLFGAMAHTDPVLWPQRWEVILPFALRQG